MILYGVVLLSLVGTLLGTLGGIVNSQKLLICRQEQVTSLLRAEDKRLGRQIEKLESERRNPDA